VVNKVTPNKAHRVHRKNQPLARGAKGEKTACTDTDIFTTQITALKQVLH